MRRPARSISASRRREVSAGLLVFRRRNGIEVLLAHPGGPFWANKDDGVWTIPKGLVESGDLLACARREFNEETGIEVTDQAVWLTPVKQKSGKVVHAFAIEGDLDLSKCRSNNFQIEWPPRSGQWATFPEIDQVKYFDLATARRKILAYQRPFLAELVSKIETAPVAQ
jgi:predicted NUDIX family NTP pyrophosphohydrolase